MKTLTQVLGSSWELALPTQPRNEGLDKIYEVQVSSSCLLVPYVLSSECEFMLRNHDRTNRQTAHQYPVSRRSAMQLRTVSDGRREQDCWK